MDKLRMESPDMTAQNIDRIAALFPNCVTEASDGHGGIKRTINFELLKQMLSPDVVEGDERYEFTWVGKKAAIVEANKPIRKTLRPCVEESKDWDTTENLYIEGDNLEVLKINPENSTDFCMLFCAFCSNECTFAYTCHSFDLTVRVTVIQQLQSVIYLSGSVFLRPALMVSLLCACNCFSGLCALYYHSSLKLCKGKKHRENQIAGERVLNKPDI